VNEVVTAHRNCLRSAHVAFST